MKKLLLILLILPLVSFGQKFEDDFKNFEAFERLIIIDSESTIDRFGFFKEKPWIIGDYSPSFFKGSWWAYLGNNPIIYLLETTFGIPIFNSGPHKEYLNTSSNDFGQYNPLFLEKVIGSLKSLSPISKKIIQPFYDSHFKDQLRELMQNRISVYFSNHSNENFLDKIKNRYDHNLLVQEIKSTDPEIPEETLFWIRRTYDGTSDKFLKLFQLIIEEMDESEADWIGEKKKQLWINSKNEKEYYVSSKSGLNVREKPSANSNKTGIILYNQKVKILSRSGNKSIIKDTDRTTGIVKTIEGEWVEILFGTNLKGYVFDGFLKELNLIDNNKSNDDSPENFKFENKKYYSNSFVPLLFREGPNINSKVLDRIKYGEELVINTEPLKKHDLTFYFSKEYKASHTNISYNSHTIESYYIKGNYNGVMGYVYFGLLSEKKPTDFSVFFKVIKDSKGEKVKDVIYKDLDEKMLISEEYTEREGMETKAWTRIKNYQNGIKVIEDFNGKYTQTNTIVSSIDSRDDFYILSNNLFRLLYLPTIESINISKDSWYISFSEMGPSISIKISEDEKKVFIEYDYGGC